MALPKVGMTLITPYQDLITRDFSVLESLDPNAAAPMKDGEWLSLSATEGTLCRPGHADAKPATVNDTNPAVGPIWPVFTERGRYDTQAVGKVTVLFGGAFEADFKMWALEDNGNITIGRQMTVINDNSANLDGQARGLLAHTGVAANAITAGWVMKAPSNAGNSGSVIRVYCPGIALWK